MKKAIKKREFFYEKYVSKLKMIYILVINYDIIFILKERPYD